MSTGKAAEPPVAIITAASQGIGEAVARKLANQGWRVALMARSERVEKIAAELGGHALRGSITEVSDLRRLVDETLRQFGRIDGVVLSSGNAARGPLLEISDEDWHKGFDLLLMLAIRVARLSTPHLAAAGGGSIVNISSFAAREPDGRLAVSSVIRAGLTAFAKLYAAEHASAGIRMNNLLPGYMENAPQDPQVTARIPSRRLGAMNELAATAAFLLSADAAYINGQDILVDGGLVRGI
ncbi:SDR family oxidoreductase [Rhodoligotrophos ferricapiens]|uniref:SDR family oxidoreductase n=1 Tax=Rhodoligotrophos ferricapiens TaxID=3069264 RepID=UPI00315D7A14